MTSNVLSRLLPCILAALTTLAVPAHASGTAEAAPAAAAQSLLISYQVPPANRAAFRAQLEKEDARQFQKWKDQGVLKNFRLLFNRYADSDNWDAMAVLGFATPADLGRWQMMERVRPAGLSPRALALTSAIHSTPVETPRSAGTADAAAQSVFVVIPYTTLVPAPDYLKYADGYVLPQFEGWMHEGVLVHYDLYTSGFPAGRPWSALIVLEYKNDEALAARNAVVAKVRARLSSNPEWKTISDSKTRVREEKQVVVAEQIVPN